ncbi:hypothetical protein AAGG74_15405 [Bacillus mexicanus]|uniref:hypothetical protein n=1 Tax=Bacillus mexicanus TaxID=2834415 RepID=UPI003D1AD7EE
MNESTLEVRYALFTVVRSDPFTEEKQFIVDFDEEINDDEVEELIRLFAGSNHKYDYAIVEKQYRRIE